MQHVNYRSNNAKQSQTTTTIKLVLSVSHNQQQRRRRVNFIFSVTNEFRLLIFVVTFVYSIYNIFGCYEDFQLAIALHLTVDCDEMVAPNVTPL